MYLSELDVLRIHGTLLGIGELSLTLPDDEVSLSTELFQVSCIKCFLKVESTVLSRQATPVRTEISSFNSCEHLISPIHPMHLCI